MRMRAFCCIATEGFGYVAKCGTEAVGHCTWYISWLAGQSVKGISQPSGSNQSFWCIMNPIVVSNCNHSHS
jgi:hypothetical protein